MDEPAVRACGGVLAIAGAVRVLILDDIPHLSAENYNEAKRFVTLIDALYEAKVRLICLMFVVAMRNAWA